MRNVGRISGRLALATALASLVGSAALLSSGGCSVLLDLTADQCSTNADCAQQGAGFANYVCDTGAHVCVPPTLQDAGGCTTNKACTDENGQVPYICKTPGAACVPLLSEDCQKIIGDYTDDNAVFYGILLNHHPEDPYESAPVDGIDLAVDEISRTLVGLPLGKNGRPRPMVFVSCDTQNDRLRPAKHLIEDIGVPAIVGPSQSDEVVEVALKEAIPNGVMILSPQATSPQLRKLSDQGLVWEMEPLRDAVADLWGKFLPQLEDDVKTKLNVTTLKVAVVASKATWSQAVADVLAKKLVFNGKTGAENAADTPPAFKRYDFDPANPDFAPIINDLWAFQPNILIPLNDGEAPLGLQVPLEQGWPMDVPKPIHLLGSEADTDATTKMAQTLGADFMLRTFKSALGLPPDKTNYNNFQVRFQGKFQKPPLNIAAFGYDAGYLLAYASVAAGEVPSLTGDLVAKGMFSLLGPGPAADVGSDALSDSFSVLIAHGKIDFRGAYGDYGFDNTGANQGYYGISCGKPAGIWSASGTVYDTAAGDFIGTFNCPLPY